MGNQIRAMPEGFKPNVAEKVAPSDDADLHLGVFVDAHRTEELLRPPSLSTDQRGGKNPDHVQKGVSSVLINGDEAHIGDLPINVIPPVSGKELDVEVILG